MTPKQLENSSAWLLMVVACLKDRNNNLSDRDVLWLLKRSNVEDALRIVNKRNAAEPESVDPKTGKRATDGLEAV